MRRHTHRTAIHSSNRASNSVVEGVCARGCCSVAKKENRAFRAAEHGSRRSRWKCSQGCRAAVRKPAPPPGHARVPDVVGGRGVPRQRGATDSHSDGSSIAADRLFRRPCGSQWLLATATTSRQRRLTSYDDFHLTIELELVRELVR